MPQGIDVLKNYCKQIKDKPELYLLDYLSLKNRIKAATIKQNGAAIGFVYTPLFYSQSEIRNLEVVTLELAKIMDKVIQEYLENPEFRKSFNFPEELEELILLDPGYEAYFPMARFDLFYDFTSGSIKFCELNADGSSGMTKSLVLDQEFNKSQAIATLHKEYKISHFDPVKTWIKTLLKIYAKFKGSSLHKPTIAIMDINWSQQGLISEFQEFQRRLIALGYPTIICDPRDLKFVNGKLYYQDKTIDLIYRRAVTSDLLKIYGQISNLIEALKSQAVCMIGSFRSQVIHNKQTFAIIHDPQLTWFLTDKEKNFIKKYIPYTALFKEKNLKEVLENRCRWVLKPLDSYQSQGVYIGRDYTDKQWEKIVYSITTGEYLLQEFVEVPKVTLINFVENKLVEEQYNQMIGLFLYNKTFQGFYTRVSQLNNVASGLGAVAISNLIVSG